MEVLTLLEKKIGSLLELVNKFKDENSKLKAENAKLTDESAKLLQKVESLTSKIESIKGAAVERGKDLDELSQEKAVTKMVVDDLIKNIDSFVEKEKQQ